MHIYIGGHSLNQSYTSNPTKCEILHNTLIGSLHHGKGVNEDSKAISLYGENVQCQPTGSSLHPTVITVKWSN
jgi:hypothetical protein